MIKYRDQDLPVLSVEPDWSDPVSYSENWGGVILESLSNAEYRRLDRHRPLFGIKFAVTSMESHEAGYFHKTMESALSLPLCCPLWNFRQITTQSNSANDDAVIVEDTAIAPWTEAGWVIVWNDFDDWEVRKVFSVSSSTQINFVGGMEQARPAGTSIAPLCVGRVRQPSFSAITDENSRFDIEFQEYLVYSYNLFVEFALSGTQQYEQQPMRVVRVGSII